MRSILAKAFKDTCLDVWAFFTAVGKGIITLALVSVLPLAVTFLSALFGLNSFQAFVVIFSVTTFELLFLFNYLKLKDARK